MDDPGFFFETRPYHVDSTSMSAKALRCIAPARDSHRWLVSHGDGHGSRHFDHEPNLRPLLGQRCAAPRGHNCGRKDTVTCTDSRQICVSWWPPHYCGWGLSPRSGQLSRAAAACDLRSSLTLGGGLWRPVPTHPSSHSTQSGAASRLYGGIRFPFDNDDGLTSGQCIGRVIIDRVRFRDEDND
jgi:hypothetical protein